jgi:hypothetical protein
MLLKSWNPKINWCLSPRFVTFPIFMGKVKELVHYWCLSLSGQLFMFFPYFWVKLKNWCLSPSFPLPQRKEPLPKGRGCICLKGLMAVLGLSIFSYRICSCLSFRGQAIFTGDDFTNIQYSLTYVSNTLNFFSISIL